MAHEKNHDYHILNPSIWPFLGSVSAFVMLIGAVFWMHGSAPWMFFIGFVGVLYVMYAWWAETVAENQVGDHTPVVTIGLRYGFIMFIMSEVMFFAAWFWGFFKNALYPMGPLSPAVDGLATGCRNIRPMAPAADQHVDSALLGLCSDMGAPRVGP